MSMDRLWIDDEEFDRVLGAATGEPRLCEIQTDERPETETSMHDQRRSRSIQRFAEAFDMKATRIVVTADGSKLGSPKQPRR